MKAAVPILVLPPPPMTAASGRPQGSFAGASPHPAGPSLAGDGAARVVPGLALLGACLVALLVLLGGRVPSAAAETPCPNEEIRVEQHSAFLPDCRAYEQVSPVEKNGGDVLLDSARMRAAVNGEAAQFSSITAFGDVEGTGITADYIAERGPEGWTTHGITPRQEPTQAIELVVGHGESFYEGEFSPDLSKGVLLANHSPFLPLENSGGVANLLVRDNLLTSGPGAYQLVTKSVTPRENSSFSTLGYKPLLDGTSADFSHILFESTLALTAEAAENGLRKLYEWEEGTVRLVGTVPPSGEPSCGGDGEPACVPAEASLAGQGSSLSPLYKQEAISSDGLRVVFTVPTETCGGLCDGGELFLREGHDRTVRVNISEKTSPEVQQEAHFQAASVDGRYIFFTTGEQLTDADTNSLVDLYRFDADAPAGHRLTLLSAHDEPADIGNGFGVLGASDNGQYVYFAMLGEGLPTIYLWHENRLRRVAILATPGQGDSALDEDAGTKGWQFVPRTARISPDGKNFLFTAYNSDGLPGDNGSCGSSEQAVIGGCRELYLYDAEGDGGAGSLVCVSCNPDGTAPTHNSTDVVRTNQGAAQTTFQLNHPLSDDGRYVFFSSNESLVPGDTNGVSDAYEYDATAGTVHLISSGTDPAPSYFMDATPSGSDVFFATRAELVSQDHGEEYDLYDARVGGGIPAQNPPAAAAGCVGEECHGPATATTVSSAPGSSALNAHAEEPRPPKKNQKKQHKKQRKHHKKKRKHHKKKGRGSHHKAKSRNHHKNQRANTERGAAR